jgi:hypothetical protein
MNAIHWIGIIACAALFTTVVATTASLSSKDTANNTKLLSAIIGFSIAAGIIGFFLAFYFFSYNVEYMAVFLLAVIMIVCIPGTLISIAVSSVTVSNMRDTLAAGN